MNKISSYKLLNVLGKGAFGIVGLYEKDKVKYVIKNVKTSQIMTSASEKIIPFLIRNFSTSKCHKNVVCLDYYFVEGPDTYLIYQYIDGIDLSKWIIDNIHMNPKQLLITKIMICIQICDGFNFIHEMGISHRDIKPQNIIITGKNKDTPVIIDFGLSCLETEHQDFKKYRTLLKEIELATIICQDKPSMVGTMNYMAPELKTQTHTSHATHATHATQASHASQASQAFINYKYCDLYSIGMTFRTLFQSGQKNETIEKIITSLTSMNPKNRISLENVRKLLFETAEKLI